MEVLRKATMFNFFYLSFIPLCTRFNDYYIGVKIASLAARTIHLFFMVQLKVRAAKVHVACVAYLGRLDYLWRIAVAPRSLEFRAQVRAVRALRCLLAGSLQ